LKEFKKLSGVVELIINAGKFKVRLNQTPTQCMVLC